MDEFLDKIWEINRLYLDRHTICITTPQIAALALCTNKNNFDKFKEIASFREILSSLNFHTDLFGIQTLQIGIINAAKKLKIAKFDILHNVYRLKNEKIVSDIELDLVEMLLNSINVQSVIVQDDIKSHDFSFYKKIDILNDISDKLVCLDEDTKNRILSAKKSANEESFTISVTGVINAGKSSMLNALLGKDILGASRIPETANLTIIKFSQKPYVNVHFYTKDEMKSFGYEGEFENKNINIDELISYTSAKNEISKYIKLIELGLDVDILKDGINIVDTPGLDDCVVAREELTRDFMKSSDAIIHLMNASQSSTKKDMTFIVDTLKSSKNRSLIIVLTHADMLSDKDLLESINYTKYSVKSELESFEFSEDLLDEISFFCIDSISKNGIAELKMHLYEQFFGVNSKKANLILSSYKKELEIATETLIKKYKFKIANILNEKSELIEAIKKIEAKIGKFKEKIVLLNQKLDEIKKRLDYSDSYDFASLKNVQSMIKDRIVSDLRYAQNKRQNIDYNRLKIICESGFNDAIVDIFRNFSQKIAKDIQNLIPTLWLKDQKNNFFFDTKKFINSRFNEPNYRELNSSMIEIVRGDKDILVVSKKLNALFSNFINDLNLQDEFQKISKECTKHFADSVSRAFKNEENTLLDSEEELKNIINLSTKDMEIVKSDAVLLEQKLRDLSQIKQRIAEC